MKLATARMADGTTSAVRIDDDDSAVRLPHEDVGAVLRSEGWRAAAEAASGERLDLRTIDYAPVVVRPSKIVCVGLNYRSHILESGLEVPAYPTLFAKFTECLLGANDDIVLPPESESVDWEAELAVVIGTRVRRASADKAANAIAGYSVLNDISIRDWQQRTAQWLQGKTFEATTPVGPWLVTPDETDGANARISCTVDGEEMQRATTSDLVFGPVDLVSYISTVVTLQPGDIIATGTPGGVGAARRPRRFLHDGSDLLTAIEGVGVCRNRCVRLTPALAAPSSDGAVAGGR
ncbi:MAG: fumarylacetoacetate hydrolase family protein [Microbacteriaceae bacterium]